MTADHLESRRREIVLAALRCFAREGFHATSVRDVVRESGLSAGAVYSYFPSKAELVAGAVAPILEALTGVLDAVVLDGVRSVGEDRTPTEAVAEVLRRIYPIAVGGEVDYTRVAVTAWAEGLRDPAVRAIAERTYGTVRGRLTDRVTRWRDAGHLPADVDAGALGQVLLSTLLGFVLQHALLGDVDLDRYATAVALLLPRG
ncbi:transcriptional regulator, TetR family [Geodermatophilus pulveris]|uniref:Transcriptional regulator, TetR family n=1 Tax=Geodermatophilus pulveris TaxID=1564159 RepID=A0A239D6E0_9ACTN|nr:TetR/AcrR family transcriptional regulator [Geodermatophilus pulveris]SNS27424.1 transcriptional regulator, TetR family [Geodermatophilus pulveris]